MSYECPQCAAAALEIGVTIELHATRDDDEVQIQLLKCAACGFEALGVYRESRHGSLDDRDSWHHDGYQGKASGLESLRRAIELGPGSKDRPCRCGTHPSLPQYP